MPPPEAVALVTALLATQIRHVHLEIRRRANWPAAHPNVVVQTRLTDLFGGEGVGETQVMHVEVVGLPARLATSRASIAELLLARDRPNFIV